MKNKYRGGTSDATTSSSLDFCCLKITRDQKTDRLMDGPTSGLTNRQTDGQMDGCTRHLIEMRKRI